MIPATTPMYAPLANKNQPQISIELVEPRPFNVKIMLAKAWLSTKC